MVSERSIPDPSLEPLVLPRNDGLQLSYQFPHRVYDSKVYPIQSPNGSTIIIYGHDLGIKILWRGGRKFKREQKASPQANEQEKKVNGTDNDAIMIIDSDDEEPAANTQQETQAPLFEDEEDEVDIKRPFQNILQHADIHLGLKVLGISVPSIQPGATRFLDSYPPILSGMIVIAAACSDSSIRVIAAPLIPPPPTSESPDSWNFQTITLGEGSFQAIPTTVSITFTCRIRGDDDNRRRSRSRSRATQDPSRSKSNEIWDLLLATHTMEASGKISVYRVPLTEQSDQNKMYNLSTEHQLPIEQQYLDSPASDIAFSPCQYPSDRHSHLLVSFPKGFVKIYSCLSKPPQQMNTRGSWFATLYTEYDQSSLPIPRRKPIVDAKWALGGKGIIVLQSDGEWGVWDIEGSNPTSRSENTKGGSVNSFAITGRPAVSLRSPRSSAPFPPPAALRKPQFAPLTPSTRRIREEALFKGTHNPTTDSSTRGSISVIPLNQTLGQPADESVLIWHGEKNTHIPSLLSVCRRDSKVFSTVEHSNRSRPTLIENIRLLGENQKGICFLSPPMNASDEITPHLPDILITAEHRLTILAAKLVQSKQTDSEPQETAVQSADDQFMLGKGELGLDGMDRLLASMTSNRPGAIQGLQQSKGFS